MHGDCNGDASLKGWKLNWVPRLAFVGGFETQRRFSCGPVAALAGCTASAAFATVTLRNGEHYAGLVERVLQVAGAVITFRLEHVGPASAAIGGAMDSAPVMGVVTESRDDDEIGVGGVDDDAVNLYGVLEPNMLPGLAGIGGLPHAVAKAAADRVAGTGIDDIGIGWRDLDGADAVDAGLLIEDGGPCDAGAGGLPDAAEWGAEIEGAGVADDTGYGGDTPTVEGPYITPLEARVEVGIHLRRSD